MPLGRVVKNGSKMRPRRSGGTPGPESATASSTTPSEACARSATSPPLGARAADGVVELAVADSGPGVPADLRGRIFEPFFTTRPRGTGLGLAVARQIVEAHGGRIDVGEDTGGGARFTVRLPVAA